MVFLTWIKAHSMLSHRQWTLRRARLSDRHSGSDETVAGHYRLHTVAMRSLKASISKSSDSRIRCRSMPSLQKDASWRAVTASKKFVAYERQFSSLWAGSTWPLRTAAQESRAVERFDTWGQPGVSAPALVAESIRRAMARMLRHNMSVPLLGRLSTELHWVLTFDIRLPRVDRPPPWALFSAVRCQVKRECRVNRLSRASADPIPSLAISRAVIYCTWVLRNALLASFAKRRLSPKPSSRFNGIVAVWAKPDKTAPEMTRNDQNPEPDTWAWDVTALAIASAPL